MIQYIYPYKGCLLGFCFLIIFAVLCYLWYHHSIESYHRELSKSTDVLLQLSESENVQESAQTETPIMKNSDSVENMSVSVEESSHKTGIPLKDIRQDKSVSLVQQPKPDQSEVRVSPHGFGPYPEIPPDFPRQDLWDYHGSLTAEHELLLRVQVKLWKQGIHAIGGAMINGRVYPNVPGTVYVKWENRVRPDGTVERYASRISGDPNTGKVIRKIINSKGEIHEGDIPADIHVIESDEGGIDPYQFLDLN